MIKSDIVAAITNAVVSTVEQVASITGADTKTADTEVEATRLDRRHLAANGPQLSNPEGRTIGAAGAAAAQRHCRCLLVLPPPPPQPRDMRSML